ncbi:helix-turn-helix domain-containing protein [Raoultibacter phocaeensis]|uniref:helix-turn-helix domain-containing protein n=1 Tax=Raoultibacter phocaeensis TaxID=2479841 RepID=UPI0015D5C2BE|nr:helix-turn-helix transcriptional regulator [Raoultibacter phocaeensis]
MPNTEDRRDMRAIKQSLQAFAQTAASQPALWIGFACVCAWPWSCTSATLVYANAGTVGSPVWLGSNLTYLIIGLCGIALGLGFRKSAAQLPSTAIAAIAGVCYVAASALFVLLSKLPSDYLDPGYATISSIWPVFAGVGQTLLFLEWMKAFGRTGPKKTIALVVCGSILGTALIFSLNFIPQTIRELMPAAIGACGAFCAFLMSKQPGNDNSAPNAAIIFPEKTRAPWKLLVTAAVAGFSFGTFQSLSFTGSFGTAAWYTFGIVGFLVASVLFALITLGLKMNFNYMIYRISFVIMATGAFLCLFGTEVSAWGYGVYCIGYRCFDMLIWCLCAYLIRHRNVSPVWLGGFSIGTLLLGRFLGFEMFTILHPLPASTDVSLLVASVLFLLMLTALSLVSHNNLLEAWGMAKPSEASSDAEILASCCAQIGDIYHLSDRERDVLERIAQGKSRADTGVELVLSEETVKTHIRHIYQKCDIHSRKELDNMVEARVREIKDDRIDLMQRDAAE